MRLLTIILIAFVIGASIGVAYMLIAGEGRSTDRCLQGRTPNAACD
jgi:hypothetical protein